MQQKWEYNGTAHQLLIDFEKAYESVRSELCNILTEFGIPMKLVRLINMCLNEAYIKMRIGKNLSNAPTVQDGLKQGDALWPLFFNFALDYAMKKVREKGEGLELHVTHQTL
jgi:hypothetical protein